MAPVLLVIGTLLVLSSCGLARAQAKPTPTPTAQQILARAEAANVAGASIAITVVVTEGAQADNGSGTMRVTRNPPRADLTITFSSAASTLAGENSLDVTSGNNYVKVTQPPELASDKWTKVHSFGSLFTSVLGSSPQLDASKISQLLDPIQLTNPELVGAERVSGVDVWHVQGTMTQQSETATVDLFVRRDTYLPVKLALHAGGASPVELTYVYTAVNTGLTISLPPAEQVQVQSPWRPSWDMGRGRGLRAK